MYAGRIVEEAATEQLFANPRHPYTLGLLNSVPRLDEARKERLVPIPGMPPDLIDVPPGCPFYPRCTYRAAGSKEQRCRLLRPVDGGHQAACWVDIRTTEPHEIEDETAIRVGGGRNRVRRPETGPNAGRRVNGRVAAGASRASSTGQPRLAADGTATTL